MWNINNCIRLGPAIYTDACWEYIWSQAFRFSWLNDGLDWFKWVFPVVKIITQFGWMQLVGEKKTLAVSQGELSCCRGSYNFVILRRSSLISHMLQMAKRGELPHLWSYCFLEMWPNCIDSFYENQSYHKNHQKTLCYTLTYINIIANSTPKSWNFRLNFHCTRKMMILKG